MKPTIGRIVHYWPAANLQPVPAIVTHVWTDTCVNLRVFRDAPPDSGEHVTSVTRCDQGDGWGWDWPAREEPVAEQGEKQS